VAASRSLRRYPSYRRRRGHRSKLHHATRRARNRQYLARQLSDGEI
jgi:hypothetical protein